MLIYSYFFICSAFSHILPTQSCNNILIVCDVLDITFDLSESHNSMHFSNILGKIAAHKLNAFL